jgi:hypothetical protein
MTRTKKLFLVSSLAVTVATTFFMASCGRRNKDTTTTEDTGYATEQSISEKSYNDAESIADQAANTTGSSLAYKTTGITSACANITRTTGLITVDFGTTNCLCNDGRYRRGKILISYTGAYADSGSTHTITFDNFYQNDNKVEGTKTVTNMGHNSLGQPYFNVTVNGTITLASGAGTVVTNSNRVRTWTDGYTTLGDFSDDKYSLTGSGTITRPSGTVVTVNISSAAPLILVAGCRWVEAGTITFTLPSGLSRSINYGNTAACDNQAVLTTTSGTTINITLP